MTNDSLCVTVVCHFMCNVCQRVWFVTYRCGLDLEQVWEPIVPQELWPSARYGHSAVVYEVK